MSWVDTTPDEYELTIWITINQCNIFVEYFIIGSVSLYLQTRREDTYIRKCEKILSFSIELKLLRLQIYHFICIVYTTFS